MSDFQLTDPSLTFGANDTSVPGLTQAPPSSSSAAPPPSSPLGTLEADLASIVGTLKQGNDIKSTAGEAVNQFEALLGLGAPAPAAKQDDSGSTLTIVAVLLLLVVGAVVVWKLAHKGAA